MDVLENIPLYGNIPSLNTLETLETGIKRKRENEFLEKLSCLMNSEKSLNELNAKELICVQRDLQKLLSHTIDALDRMP